jgi:broad specificity phosphatase PhoE
MVRHGESTGNVAHARAERDDAEQTDIPEWDADVPLSDLGCAQSQALGRRLAAGEPPDVVISSPYLRALQTARIALPDTSVIRDERLRDREMGVLYRLTPKGVAARFPEELARLQAAGKFYYRPPGGEAWTDIALRLRTLLAELAREQEGRRVLIVAHDVVIVLARYIIEGLSVEEILEIEKEPVANCSISRWRYENGTPQPVMYNDISHLLAY